MDSLKEVLFRRQLDAYDELMDAIVDYDLTDLSLGRDYILNKLIGVLSVLERNFLYLDQDTTAVFDARISKPVKAQTNYIDERGVREFYHAMRHVLMGEVVPVMKKYFTKRFPELYGE